MTLDGREAIEALCAIPYDLVLMDVQMPEMDGLEATRQIRAREQQAASNQEPATRVPIIAMTAYAMAGDREKCFKAGMNGYVSKPIDPLALANELEKWIGKDAPGAEKMNFPIKEEKTPDEPKKSDELNKSDEPNRADDTNEADDPNEADESNEASSSRIFDREDLLKRLMDDQGLAKTIVTGFLDDMPRQISALKSFVENGQPEQAGGQAHKVKGAAGNVTALVLQETAHAMEQAGKTGDLELLKNLLPELEQRFLQLKKYMESDKPCDF